MRKFIDADRLRAEIEKERQKALDSKKRGGLTISDIATSDTLAEVLLIIEQLQKEQPALPSNLDEAAEEYLQKVKAGFIRTLEHPTAKECFIHGAKWQAEQDKETIELAEEHAYLAGSVNEREKMMKEGVEGQVFTNPKPMNIIVENEQWEKLLGQFDNGQRVRIILVKEDAE